ncbi:MAG: Hpt domain-containing protein [Rubrivivax sp.]
MSNPTATPQAAATALPPRHDAAAALAFELDATALNRLRELDPTGENHVLQRVMVAFEGSLTRLMQQADVAQSSNDINAIRHVVHTLKSSSASVGALELSSCCALIEQQLREHRTEHLAQHLGAWRSEAARVLVAVKTARFE